MIINANDLGKWEMTTTETKTTGELVLGWKTGCIDKHEAGL